LKYFRLPCYASPGVLWQKSLYHNFIIVTIYHNNNIVPFYHKLNIVTYYQNLNIIAKISLSRSNLPGVFECNSTYIFINKILYIDFCQRYLYCDQPKLYIDANCTFLRINVIIYDECHDYALYFCVKIVYTVKRHCKMIF